MTGVGYAILTLIVSAYKAQLPFLVAPALAFVFGHQAGWIVNTLATFIALEGQAALDTPCSLFYPVLGLLAKMRFGSVLKPTVTHTGKRALFDAQAGYVAEAVFYVLLGAASFGWDSVMGWPIALAGLLGTVLLRPWIQ